MTGENTDISLGGATRVAILVVHGVAAKAAFESLDAVTDMLASHHPEHGGSYSSAEKTAFLLSIDEKAVGQLANVQGGPELLEFDTLKNPHFDRLAMQRRLREYIPEEYERHFKTERNELKRRFPGPKTPDKDIHIYECFWADLSRGGNYDYFKKFVAFYEFLLDLCILGRISLLPAMSQHKQRFPWWPLRCLQEYLHIILAGTIPALNLLLLSFFMLIPVLCQQPNFQRWFFPIMGGVLTVLGVSGFLAGRKAHITWWPYAAISAGIFTSLLIFGVLNTPAADYRRTMCLATAFGVVLILSGMWTMAWMLRKSRPRLAWNLFGGAGLIFLVVLWALNERTPRDVGEATILRAAEFLMALCKLIWISYFFAAALLTLATSILRHQDATSKENRAALKTLQLSTALAGLLLLIVNLCAWQVAPYLVRFAAGIAVTENVQKKGPDVFETGNDLRLAEDWCQSKVVHPITGRIDTNFTLTREIIHTNLPQSEAHLFPLKLNDSSDEIVRGIDSLLQSSTCNAIHLILLALITAFLIIVMAFWPTIQIECHIKRSGSATREPLLDRAFDSLGRVGGFVIWWIMLLIPLYCTGLFFAWPGHELQFPGLLAICGTLLLVAVAKVFGPILAVTLDVINWLRDIPKENTPRARIVARMLAILTKIRDEHKLHPYEKLIIVAHSQGTVIAVETLRALQVKPLEDITSEALAGLNELPSITLFTMGCPLRQLYACRFPHLFSWVEGREADNPKPNPHELFKVRRWVNAYGLADYVGRYLWVDSVDPNLPVVSAWDGVCEQFCIGEEAHTHYWDIGSPIAGKLDELI